MPKSISLPPPDQSLALTSPLPLTRHPAMVYLRSLAPSSRPTMEHALNTIASLLTNNTYSYLTLDWSLVKYEHTSAIQAVLLEKYKTTTAKKMICALKRVLKEARKLGLITMDEYIVATDLPTITPHNNLRGRALSNSEIKKIMEVCLNDESQQGVRDAALIAVLRGSGLRRGEMVALNVGDLNVETQTLNIRHGKGGKERIVYLPDSAMKYINNWLSVRGRKPGALICPILKSGKIQNRHMSSEAVLLILKKRSVEAGIEYFSPHDLRRTFCSDLLDAGVDIVTVQKLVGHASPSTTSKYDRRGEETKRKAVQNLGF